MGICVVQGGVAGLVTPPPEVMKAKSFRRQKRAPGSPISLPTVGKPVNRSGMSASPLLGSGRTTPRSSSSSSLRPHTVAVAPILYAPDDPRITWGEQISSADGSAPNLYVSSQPLERQSGLREIRTSVPRVRGRAAKDSTKFGVHDETGSMESVFDLKTEGNDAVGRVDSSAWSTGSTAVAVPSGPSLAQRHVRGVVTFDPPEATRRRQGGVMAKICIPVFRLSASRHRSIPVPWDKQRG